jgi:P4 family phage/plasmid primase-like protien
MSFLTISELSTLKKLTGGDSVFAEFKGQNGFEFVYDGLLWFCMNRLPKFGGDDGEWVYNRIIQVNCNNVIPIEKQDKMLLDKLYAERNGIIYKVITALKNVINNGYFFTEPSSVKDLRKKYMAENNTVIAFFNECMVERPELKIKDNCTTGKVYDVYKAWCTDNNHGYSKTAKEFRQDLSRHLNIPYADLITRRGKGGNFYIRYTLSDEAKENYRKAYGWDDIPLLASNQ